MNKTTILLDRTISLTQCENGKYGVYDTTQGMNIGMRCESERAAMFEAIKHYQKRFIALEMAHDYLKLKVQQFVLNVDIYIPD